MYRCTNFEIEELVPPETFAQVAGHTWKLWMLFDPRALLTLDALRNRYSVTWVNTWSFSGDLKYKGFRSPGCKIGSRYSQHRFGRAFDTEFKFYPADEVRADIRGMNYETRKSYGLHMITRIERAVKWFHFDTGNNPNPREIQWISP